MDELRAAARVDDLQAADGSWLRSGASNNGMSQLTVVKEVMNEIRH